MSLLNFSLSYFNLFKINIDEAQEVSEKIANHAQTMQKQITALQGEINEQNAAIYLPVVESAYAELLETKKVLESRLLKLNGSYDQDPNSLLYKLSQDSSPTSQQKLKDALIEREALLKELKEIEKKIENNEKIQSFLKVRKIEIEVHNLSNAYYGDPNSLLDWTLKTCNRIWKQGMGYKEDYDRLENYKNILIAERKKLQVLCPNVGFLNLQVELPQILIKMITKLETEQKAALDAIAFIKELRNWYEREGCSAGAKKACGKIFTCYIQNTFYLQQGEKLDISCCRLKSLPKIIGKLTRLKELKININDLQTLPSEIGNLTQLKELTMNFNQFQIFPSEISNLTQLTDLNICYNKLQTLPSYLARFPSSCTIRAEANSLSFDAVQAFQDQIGQQRSISSQCGPNFEFSIYDENKLSDNSTLEAIVTFWLQLFQSNFPCENVHYKALSSCIFEKLNGDFYKPLQNLSPEEDNNLRTYLDRLKDTDDFKHSSACQMLILDTICMLHGICTNKGFKEMVFLILEDALSHCGDRVSEARNRIYLQRLFRCGSKTLNKKQTIKLLVGAMRVDKLECFARKITKERKLGDEIETILYFKKELKKMINLPIATEGMLYPAMSGVTPSDLQQAQAFILEDTSSTDQILAILLNSELWKEKIKQENAKEFEEIEEQFGAKLKEILDNDKLSSKEIKARTEKLTTERTEAIQAYVRELTVSDFCPATQVLEGLGIKTNEEYSQKLECTPKHLQSIGILTVCDLAVLGISNNPLPHLPMPKAEAEKPDDSREVQKAAFKKKESLLECLNNMAEKVKMKLKLNPENESLQKTCNALLEKIEVAAANLEKECQTSKALLATFELDSHIQIVLKVNTLVDEFNKVDCALQVAKLHAYISQWGILKAWKELKEQGIQCLEELKEQGAVENFFQMGV